MTAQVDTHAQRRDAKQAWSARMGSAVGLKARCARILLKLFPQSPSNLARDLGAIGRKRQKQLKRRVVDEMRRELGLKPIKWGPLR